MRNRGLKKFKLKSMHKKNLKNSFLYGIVYAIGMSTFHYFKYEEVRIWDFLFYLIFFGTCMWFVNRNNYKK